MEEKNEKGNEQELTSENPPEETAKGEGTPELERLRQELAAKEIEAKENYDRFLRQLAEVENLKKRMAREKVEAIRFANESLIKEFLPVMDNLERAIGHAKEGENGKPLVEGVEMVLKGLIDVLSKHGVTQILAKGEMFDPEKHEAIAHVETEEHEPNTIVEEHHKGYFLLDRLLRPSLVSVAKPPKTKDKKEKNGEIEKRQGND